MKILKARKSHPDSAIARACALDLSFVVDAWITLLGASTSRKVVSRFSALGDTIRPDLPQASCETTATRIIPGDSMDEKLAQLERISSLRASGAITEEEFSHLKATILNPPSGG
ncbi:MAG: SHOCT domain-containing protein [Propioniciclava sp.]|nr:SHOCT domain-containing protein [Propioniciclava sp.]